MLAARCGLAEVALRGTNVNFDEAMVGGWWRNVGRKLVTYPHMYRTCTAYVPGWFLVPARIEVYRSSLTHS